MPERFDMLVLLVSFLCCFLQAAHPSFDGANPIFLASSGAMMDCASEQWREKIKTCLKQEGQVRVFYLPKEEERYSVTYDIKSHEIDATFKVKHRSGSLTIPLQYALQQEFLQGYVLKPGCRAPGITGVEFSHKDVDKEHYEQKQFFSPGLDYFLTESFPRVGNKGRESFDNDEEHLTTDMLKTALPEGKFKRFCWKVVREDEALDVLQQSKKAPEVLLIIGGVGVLWGQRVRCFLQNAFDLNKRCLLYYKLDRVLENMCAKYPVSE